ncbi:tail-related protein [Alteromonas phage vB_AmeP_PT11-V19]|nr:tail-related protein [Alteromonas phage vB_AmeP_PT11-V19]
MLVSDVINLARGAELNNLAIKDDKDAIISFINLGMLELYKRFDLINEAAVLTLKEGVYSYSLNGKDDNVQVENDKYDLIKIVEVHYDCEPIPINDSNKENSVGTPRYNCVEFPACMVEHGKQVAVVYRASPKFALHERDELDLPVQLVEALLHYVGYRGHLAISGGMQDENNTHYLRFDKSCKMVEEENLGLFDNLSSNKFQRRGFV